jgi:hypothetical protein
MIELWMFWVDTIRGSRWTTVSDSSFVGLSICGWISSIARRKPTKKFRKLSNQSFAEEFSMNFQRKNEEEEVEIFVWSFSFEDEKEELGEGKMESLLNTWIRLVLKYIKGIRIELEVIQSEETWRLFWNSMGEEEDSWKSEKSLTGFRGVFPGDLASEGIKVCCWFSISFPVEL